MSDEEKAFKAVELKVAELKLSPGSHLAMIAPEEWTPTQIDRFAQYANAVLEKRNYGFQLIVFPFGSELAVVTPDGGFVDDQDEKTVESCKEKFNNIPSFNGFPTKSTRSDV